VKEDGEKSKTRMEEIGDTRDGDDGYDDLMTTDDDDF
jgi:hypothetical protein